MKSRTAAAAEPSLEDLRREIAGNERRFRILDRQIQLLERERQKLSAVVNHSDAAFLVLDAALRVVWASEVFARQFAGPGEAAAAGRSCREVLCRREEVCASCPALGSFRTGAAAHHEMSLAIGGRPRHFYATALPLRSPQGVVEETMVMLQDVSDLEILRRSQEALRESEQRYRSLFESSVDAIIVADVERRIVDVNPAFTTIYGHTLEDVRGRTTAILYADPNEFAAFGKALAGLGDGAPLIRILDCRRKSGEGFPGEVAVFRLRRATGEAIGYVGMVRDVTEQRRLEEQLRQSQKMEAVGTLAGGVAHDFNNLLTVINGHASLALGRAPSHDPGRRDLEEIKRAGDRAASLTRQLLAFSRRQMLQPKVLSLNDVVGEMHTLLRRIIGEDIELVLRLGSGLGHVKADPGQIEQVVMNLVANARDAMPRGGRVTIETGDATLDGDPASPQGHVVLAVGDTGCGMDAEVRAHIFEPFFTTKEVGKGTGLGLSTVYGIVKQSGGSIAVSSEPGRGTTFRVLLPRCDDAPQPSVEARADVEPRGGTETVLVVEDDAVVRDLTCEILEMSGYTVLRASRGAEAMRICREHGAAIDLLVSDVVMPDIGGRELAAALVGLRPAMKVVFVSGYTDDAVLRHGALGAGTTFLQKPFEPETLSRLVRKVLDQASST